MTDITGTSKYIIHIEKISIINLPFSQTHIVNLTEHCHQKDNRSSKRTKSIAASALSQREKKRK